MGAKRIVLAEDELDLAAVVADYLALEGYVVEVVPNGSKALEICQSNPPDLLMLDIMLPGLDGISVLRAIRAKSMLPIIMATAKVEEIDRLLGLDLGADDYLCKPYSPREAVARARSVLRRSTFSNGAASCSPMPEQAMPTGLTIDRAGWKALAFGRDLELTPKEFKLLRLLAEAPGRVFSRAALLDSLGDDNLEVSERAIDSHMKNLRKKLAAGLPGKEAIRSVYGVGFVFDL